MNIPTHRLQRIWALSMAGDPEAIAEMNRLHSRYPELNERYKRFKLAILRIRSGATKKVKRSPPKGNPTQWTKNKEKFFESTTGSVRLVQGGATGLKR